MIRNVLCTYVLFLCQIYTVMYLTVGCVFFIVYLCVSEDRQQTDVVYLTVVYLNVHCVFNSCVSMRSRRQQTDIVHRACNCCVCTVHCVFFTVYLCV